MNDEFGCLDRRGLMRNLSATVLAATAVAPVLAQQAGIAAASPATSSRLPGPRPKVAMLAYPRMVLLDLIGPMTVFNVLECEIHLVWKDKSPSMTDLRVPVVPTTTFGECPADLDVLFVPGGTMGTIACMNDPEVLAFMANCGARAKYVTSVCTGAMVLGAAGLLRGYRAATNWMLMEYLPLVGATPVHERVVEDRNRLTGGGVTAGLDFALTLGAKLRGRAEAERAQLVIEYAPDPPFNAGTPETAPVGLAAQIKADRPKMDTMVEAAARKAAESWK